MCAAFSYLCILYCYYGFYLLLHLTAYIARVYLYLTPPQDNEWSPTWKCFYLYIYVNIFMSIMCKICSSHLLQKCVLFVLSQCMLGWLCCIGLASGQSVHKNILESEAIRCCFRERLLSILYYIHQCIVSTDMPGYSQGSSLSSEAR